MADRDGGERASTRTRDETRIGENREQEEEAAEQILPLGDPNNGLGAKRVDREEERNHSAARASARERREGEHPDDHQQQDDDDERAGRAALRAHPQ